MDIYKIPSCWPTTFIYGIPIAEMLQKENLIDKKFKHANNVRTDNVLLDFVFQFCVIANLGRETAHAAILTFEHFGSKIKDLSKYDIQLVAMTCILICSKVIELHLKLRCSM